MELTTQQREAYDSFWAWHLDYNPKDTSLYFTLAGNAGTGKSYLINYIVEEFSKFNNEQLKLISKCESNSKNKLEELKLKPAVVAFTNKAKKVLQKKGLSEAKTIHSLLYTFDDDPNTDILSFVRKDSGEIKKEHNLIIVDESSMITPSIHYDLLSIGLPILYIGDTFQLPPILSEEEKIKFGLNFSVLKNPNYLLTDIQRQSKNSPILHAATKVRNGGILNYFDNDNYPNYKYLRSIQNNNYRESLVVNSDVILCGSNNTVKKINDYYRQLKGYDITKFPTKGESLIVWRNNYELDIYNSDLLTVEKDYSLHVLSKPIDWKNIPDLLVKNEDSKTLLIKPIFRHYLSKEDTLNYQLLLGCCNAIRRNRSKGKSPKFTPIQRNFLIKFKIDFDEFPFQKLVEVSFGRAITVHKAQGSEVDTALIINESRIFKEFGEKWLYTAISRAKLSLVIVDFLFEYGHKHV